MKKNARRLEKYARRLEKYYAHPDFSVADLQRSWIAPPTEVTRKAGLTIFVSTAFYVALLAPDTLEMNNYAKKDV